MPPKKHWSSCNSRRFGILNHMNNFIKWLEGINAKLPALPAKVKEVLVKLSPYLAIISVLTSLQALFVFFNFAPYFSGFGRMGMMGGGMFGWYWIYLIVRTVLYCFAISPLFKRAESGWNYVFYASVIAALVGLITGNIIGALIGFAISCYFLFQIRPYFTGAAHAHVHDHTAPPHQH